jgi:hypothetical protein
LLLSPSISEVHQKTMITDATVYLPLDTKKAEFLRIVHPEMAFSNMNIG